MHAIGYIYIYPVETIQRGKTAFRIGSTGRVHIYHWLTFCMRTGCSLNSQAIQFWSMFNVLAMPNRYCDQLGKKQPDPERRRLWD